MPAAAVEEAAGGEVGALDVLEHFGEAGLGIVDQRDGGVDDFGEVVRRNVGGHADGDAVRAVDDEVGNARGQDGGLERWTRRSWGRSRRFPCRCRRAARRRCASMRHSV